MAYDAPLKQVLEAVGGPTKLADELGVSTSAVTNWQRVPARHLPRIEHLTGIPGRDLRPDLYPDAVRAA